MAFTYEPIQTVTLSSAGVITFTAIPQSFTDLRIILLGRTSWTTDSYDNVRVRFNGDSGGNYSYTDLGYALANRGSNVSNMGIPRFNPSNGGNTNPALARIDIFAYLNTNVHKTVLADGVGLQEAYIPSRSVGLWRSTAAITSIELGGAQSGALAAGTTASLFGIKAA